MVCPWSPDGSQFDGKLSPLIKFRVSDKPADDELSHVSPCVHHNDTMRDLTPCLDPLPQCET